MFNKTDVIVLCGGLGTRLRGLIGSQPKALALINGRPFLDICLSHLKKQGIKKAILAVGYSGDRIKSYCEKSDIIETVFSEEAEPLGTGGALKKALALTQSSQVMVLNGDTVCPIDYAKFLKFHIEKDALISMVVTAKKRADAGAIKMAANNLILEFRDGPARGNHPFMSAGIYLLARAAAALMPQEEIFSLEHDFFPKLVAAGKCFGYLTQSPVIDIGTPERYQAAQTSIQNFAKH